jgi:transposase
MRGRRDQQTTMLAFVDLEERVPPKHPLRVIKRFADSALGELSPIFDAMYAAGGRPSILPERLLKASLLIALYSIRSETAFCEELDYQLLYRWFLDMDLLESSFDPTVFTKNRRRLLRHDVAQRFFDEVVRQAAGLGLLTTRSRRRLSRTHRLRPLPRRMCRLGAPLGHAIQLLAIAGLELGDKVTARRLLHEALALAESVGNRQTTARALHKLGTIAHVEHDVAHATSYYEQSLVLCRDTGDGVGSVVELGNLAMLMYQVGDFERALAHARESLALRRELGAHASPTRGAHHHRRIGRPALALRAWRHGAETLRMC